MSETPKNGWSKQFDKYFLLSGARISIPPRENWFKCKSPAPQKFSNMRDYLNGVKSLLNSMPLLEWHKHTRYQNPAGFVVSEVRSKAHPELLTQAWCKFTEILFRFPVLVPDVVADGAFKSLHLCEAPGAFITALNHFIKSNRVSDFNWSWTGSTLNPYHEGNSTSSMINDDRFILHTLMNWDFGIDDTGDLLKPENLRHFVERYGHGLDLVTADGSVDCQSDPARQELLVENLHFAEILGAVGTLKVGGHFVMKMFTFFEAGTICHLSLLAAYFDKVHVFKPATSKEGNSEVYVICESFAGIDESDYEALVHNLNDGSKTALDLDEISPEFVSKIEACAQFFLDIQECVIKRNIETFEAGAIGDNKIKEKKFVATKFVKDCFIKHISNEDKIIRDNSKFVSYVDDCRQTDERVESGTFMDKFSPKSRAEQLEELKRSLVKLHPSWIPKCKKVEWISMTRVNALPLLQFSKGARFESIDSSKFCPARVIHMHKQALSMCHQNDLSPMSLNGNKKRKLDLIKFYSLKSLVVQTPILASLVELYPEVLEVQTLVIKARTQELLLKNPSIADVQEFIGQLCDTMAELRRGQHLIMLDFVLLTRLQVGLFLIVAHNFEEVGFMRPVKDDARHGIFLSEFKGDFQASKCLLEEIKVALPVLSVLPTEYVTEEPFYSTIVAHNMNVIRESSLFKLKNLA